MWTFDKQTAMYVTDASCWISSGRPDPITGKSVYNADRFLLPDVENGETLAWAGKFPSGANVLIVNDE